MYDIDKTIKHFESLQKRYITTHNGEMCKRVADALEALHEVQAVSNKEKKVENETHNKT